MINPKELYDELKSSEPHFSTIGKKHKIKLVRLIISFLNGERRHNDIDKVMYIGSQSLSSSQLKKKFGGKGGYYKTVIEPYFKCIDERYWFSSGRKGSTKKYELKEWVVDMVLNILDDPTTTTLTRISDNDKSMISISEVPENGVNQISYDGGKVRTRIQLPSLVEPNLEMIDKYIHQLEQDIGIRKYQKMENLIQLKGIKRLLNNTQYPNSLVQLYQEISQGRLVPQRGYTFNLLNVNKDIRKIMFSDMGLYSYDIRNCHFTIFHQLCKKYGYDCPNFEYYLNNKDQIRSEWVEKYGFPNKVKKYLLSWIYGNGNNPVKSNPFYNELGLDRLIEINRNDDLLSGIYRETVTGRNWIIENTPTSGNGRDGVLKNVWGNTIPLFTNGRKTTKKRLLVYILFGLESKIMEVVNLNMDQEMLVLIYDGFISKKIKLLKIQQTIKSELDFDIDFDEKLIEPPDINRLI